MTPGPFTAAAEPADLPGLRRQLAAAASAAGAEYDVSTQLVRWVERQRVERAGAAARHRARLVLSAAATLVVLVGAAAALVYRPNLPWTPTPPAEQVTAAEISSGTWQATISHLHRNPPGGTRSLATVSFTIRPDSTGELRLPDVGEPIEVRYDPSGAAILLDADPAVCPGSLVLRLTGAIRADRFTVDDAEAGPCYADPTLASELVGATFIRQEQP